MLLAEVFAGTTVILHPKDAKFLKILFFLRMANHPQPLAVNLS